MNYVVSEGTEGMTVQGIGAEPIPDGLVSIINRSYEKYTPEETE